MPCCGVVLQGGFHGRTYAAMALTTSKVIYKQHFGPLVPGVHVAPYPYCLHCKVQQEKVGVSVCVVGLSTQRLAFVWTVLLSVPPVEKPACGREVRGREGGIPTGREGIPHAGRAFCCHALPLLLLLLLTPCPPVSPTSCLSPCLPPPLLQGHSGYHVAPYIPPFDKMDNRWCCNAPLEALEWMLVQQVTGPSGISATGDTAHSMKLHASSIHL